MQQFCISLKCELGSHTQFQTVKKNEAGIIEKTGSCQETKAGDSIKNHFENCPGNQAQSSERSSDSTIRVHGGAVELSGGQYEGSKCGFHPHEPAKGGAGDSGNKKGQSCYLDGDR